MKSKLLFCMLLAIAGVVPICAQPKIDGNYIVPEPQVWSFMKYGGSQPNLYTGTVSVSIPVYTFKDKDFTIPVSLSYASNGYIPNVQANEVGLGWFLNAGGCITREVRGVQDDYSDYSILGFQYFYTTYADIGSLDPNPLNRLLYFQGYRDNYYASIERPNYKVETLPDIYHFNFLGHTGSFVNNGNGIYVFNTSDPYGTYKIKIVDRKTLVITTGDGYEYTFGGSTIPNLYGRLEAKFYSPSQPGAYYQNVDSSSYLNSWLLTQIKAPNGRCVTFKYSGPQNMEAIRPGGRKEVRGSYWSSGTGGVQQGSNILSEIYLMWYKSYSVQLEKILIDGLIDISFFYNERESENSNTPAGVIQLNTLPKLDSIKVVSKFDNHSIKRCNLGYSYSRNENKYNKILFLTSLYISGEGKYTMKYYDLENHLFPSHGTMGVDHWGYYNGQNNSTLNASIPATSLSSNFEETVTGTTRNPDPDYAKKGILETITYPTGGSTTFEYESHEYQKLVTKDYTSKNIPYLKKIQIPTKAGGVRIRKITDQTGPNPISREYIYTKGNQSSGILLHFPRYCYVSTLVGNDNKGWEERYDFTLWSTEELYSYCMDKTHIEYSQVIEKFNNGSYVKYNFSNYQCSPDTYSLTDTLVKSQHIAIMPKFANNYRRKPDYINSIRGKLLSTVYYDNTGDSLRGIYNRYDTTKQLGTILGVENAEDSFYIHPTVIKPNPLVSTSIIEYTQAGAIEKNKRFYYNDLGQLTSVKQLDSDGSIHCDSTLYIANITPQAGSSEETMSILKMYNYPLSKVQTIRKRLSEGNMDTERIIEATKYNYQSIEITTSDRKLPVLANTQKAILTGEQSPGELLSYNSESRCTHFDKVGNVLQTIDKTNVPTTYIWGYNGLYLVAKIVNCSLEEVVNITGLTSLYIAPLTGELPAGARKRLYDIENVQLKGYQATVYDHIPFFGISRITDPSGKTICYEYDSYGRLKNIKDDVGNLVKSHRYQILK